MSVEARDGQLGVCKLEARRRRRRLAETRVELSDEIECSLVAGRHELSDELGLFAEVLERCILGQRNSRHGGPFRRARVRSSGPKEDLPDTVQLESGGLRPSRGPAAP